MAKFTPREKRDISVIGWDIGFQGNDPMLIISECDDYGIEDIVAVATAHGYSVHAAEKFALRVLESGVLFSDVPPAEEPEPEEVPTISTDSENFSDTLDALSE